MTGKNKLIYVASLNKNKVNAVKEVFPSFLVEGVSCNSGEIGRAHV